MMSIWNAPSDLDWRDAVDPEEPKVKCPMTEDEIVDLVCDRKLRVDRCPCGIPWNQCPWRPT